MKFLNKLLGIILPGALLVLGVACEPEEKGPKLGELNVFFASDSYELGPGESISLPFTVTGIEGAVLALSTSVSVGEASAFVKAGEDYQGTVEFTAPAFSDGTPVKVTVKVVDPANKREATDETVITVAESDPLALSTTVSSIALKPGGSVTVPFKVGGAHGAVTVPTLSMPSGWSARSQVAADNSGIDVTITAPASIPSSVKLDITVKDSKDRTASLSVNYSVTAITEMAGAANCHIVAPGSTLTIKAVKGNSADALSFSSAKLLWEDEKGMIGAVSANGSEGVVVVKTVSGKSGNALVAALSGEEIVWSWHVWVTDYNPDSDAMTWTDTDNKSYTFMGRDLGARSNVKYSADAFGTLYQWGRKDPFIGSSRVDASVVRPYYDAEGNQLYDIIEQRPSFDDHVTTTLALSIANPTTFYTAPSSAWPCVDWLTPDAALQNDDLWGGKSGHKTIYDPCPEGWKVPVSGAPWGFRKQYKKGGNLNQAGWTTDGEGNRVSLNYDETYPWFIEYDDEYCIGFRYKDFGSGKEWWFPFAGRRNPTNGTLEGVAGGAMYHTASVSGALFVPEQMAWGNPASEGGLNRPYGAAIRCIKE